MATASQIIAKARSYLGIAEKPNNNVIFNTEYYGHEVNGSNYPWCCVFVWYIFNKCGASNLFYDGKKTAYCPTLLNWFKTNGGYYTTNPKVGDVVFFNFSGKKTASHVGIVTDILGNGKIRSIEGNTSSSNQTNGGQVEEKTRDLKYCIGFGRPKYDSNTEVKTEPEPATTAKGKSDVLFHSAAKNGVMFTVTASALKMRKDAPDGTVIVTLPKGQKVAWYGYHKIINGDLWLLVKHGSQVGYMCKGTGNYIYLQ